MSLQTQTALKAEGYPNLWALDLWEVYIKAQCNSFPVAHLRGGHPGVSGSRDSCGNTHQCHCCNSFTSAAGKGQSCHYSGVPKVLILCWEESGSGIQSPLASGSEWETEEGEISQSSTPPTPCPSCRTLLQCPVRAHPLFVLLTPPRAVCPSWPSLPVPRAGAAAGLSLPPGPALGTCPKVSFQAAPPPSAPACGNGPVSLGLWDRQQGADWLLFHFPFPKLS